MENGNQFGYFSKDMALELEVTTSTLRRWSIELEKLGYSFKRNDKDQRIYYERDFKIFRKLKELLKNDLSMENAVHAVIALAQTLPETPNVHIENDKEVRFSKSELENIIHSAVKAAIEEEREMMFKAFEMKLNDTIEKRDRILTQQLNQSMEQKRLEISAALEEKNEKKPWWKLFSK